MTPLLKIISSRKSAREFSEEKISEELLSEILKAAGRAPSAKNSQPWRLTLVDGERLEKLKNALCENFEKGSARSSDFAHDIPECYKNRAIELGKALFAHKGIAREDKSKRHEHDKENFKFFSAPQIFIVSTREEYSETTLVDLGIFIGFLLIAIEAAGIASCPQIYPLIFTDTFKKILPELKDDRLLLTLPFGFAKPNSHLNNFTSGRESAETWFRRL